MVHLLDSPFFPIVGVVLSNALYFSSFPAVVTAQQLGHLGALNVLPQALMVLASIAWMSYALALPNIYITLSNLPGVIVAVAFTSITLPLIPSHDRTTRTRVQVTLVVGAIQSYSIERSLCDSGCSAFLVVARSALGLGSAPWRRRENANHSGEESTYKVLPWPRLWQVRRR